VVNDGVGDVVVELAHLFEMKSFIKYTPVEVDCGTLRFDNGHSLKTGFD
jgi:hypothetical protein